MPSKPPTILFLICASLPFLIIGTIMCIHHEVNGGGGLHWITSVCLAMGTIGGVIVGAFAYEIEVARLQYWYDAADRAHQMLQAGDEEVEHLQNRIAHMLHEGSVEVGSELDNVASLPSTEHLDALGGHKED